MHPWKRAHALAKGRQHAHAVTWQHEKEEEKDLKKVIILILFYRALSNSEARCDPAWPVEARASVCLRIATFWCVNPGNVVECSRTCVVRRKKKEFFFLWDGFCTRMCVLRQSWIGAGILRCWSFKCTYKITSRNNRVPCTRLSSNKN